MGYDRRFGELHASICEVIQDAHKHMAIRGTIDTNIDKMYGRNIPTGQALGELVDAGYIEPVDSMTGQRSATAPWVRLTPTGKEALSEWRSRPEPERVKDSTPTDHAGNPMGEPVLPASMKTSSTPAKLAKGAKNAAKPTGERPGKRTQTRGRTSPPGANGALPRREKSE